MAGADKSIAQLSTLTGTYDLTILTGVVADASTSTVAKMYKNEVLESTAVTRGEFILVDREGLEHAVKLTNLDLPCRPGNVVTMVSAKRGKESNFIAGFNHNAKKIYYGGSIESVFGRTRLYRYVRILCVLLALAVFWSSGSDDVLMVPIVIIAGWMIGYPAGHIVSHLYVKNKLSLFEKGEASAKLRAALEGIDLREFPIPGLMPAGREVTFSARQSGA